MLDPLRAFSRLLSRRSFDVTLDGATARRVALYHKRLQAQVEADDPFYKDDPISRAEALSSLVEAGLEAEERRAGLVGTIFGEVMTVAEYERRKRASAEAQAAAGPEPPVDSPEREAWSARVRAGVRARGG